MAEDKDKAWELVQKKAFTHWVNTIVERRAIKVENLEDSFSDGITIVNFVELLCEKKLKKKYQANPRQKINKIENTHLSLEFLMENGVQKKYLTISSEDFIDRNLKLILGFLWMLFRKFRIAKNIGVDEDSTTEGLLAWCKQVTDGYKGVNIRDFKGSFADGNAFLALVHAYDKKLFDYDHQLEEHSTIENIEYAFNSAEKVLGIPQLLDAQELLDGTVDERSIVLYVSLYFHAFVSAQEKNKIEGEKKAITEKVTDLETQLIEMKEENEVLTKKLTNSEEDFKSLKSKYEEKEKALDKLQEEKEAADRELADLRAQFKKLKEKTEERSQVETKALDVLRKNLLEHLRDMNTWKDYLEQDREYESEKIQLRTEKEIADRSFEDQVDALATSLAAENRKLEVLLKQYEVEEAVADADREKKSKDTKEDAPKDKESKKEKRDKSSKKSARE